MQMRDALLVMQIEALQRAIKGHVQPYRRPHHYMNIDPPLTPREAKPEDFEEGLREKVALRHALWLIEQAKEGLLGGEHGEAIALQVLGQAKGIAWVYGLHSEHRAIELDAAAAAQLDHVLEVA